MVPTSWQPEPHGGHTEAVLNCTLAMNALSGSTSKTLKRWQCTKTCPRTSGCTQSRPSGTQWASHRDGHVLIRRQAKMPTGRRTQYSAAPQRTFGTIHMRRDDNDACGAIPRHPEEWPELSDEQIWHESNLPNLDKAADLTQMNRIWNYAPHRAGPSCYKANQSSQSSGSQQSRALQSRDQRHWKQNNTNARWGGRSASSQQRRATQRQLRQPLAA